MRCSAARTTWSRARSRAASCAAATEIAAGGSFTSLAGTRSSASPSASGNVVHNLRRVDPRAGDDGFDWARRFDEEARSLMTGAPGEVLGLHSHRDYAAAVPTPDHFIPLLYLAGLASAAGRPARTLVEGYAYGSLSMTAYTLDATCPEAPAGAQDAAAIPDPDVVATDDTNI